MPTLGVNVIGIVTLGANHINYLMKGKKIRQTTSSISVVNLFLLLQLVRTAQ